ncbi:hypothetical protein ILUMI_23927 [Ignelater luminosus]|uniref:Uncharacterized protein n=1 Tax=Ignelater luminosus TaxID=2038154 RepID=A0A8K0CA28_IGNLU|nr:hypothetical protein ILUMI_23927 [Ignelater luminosus]
MASVLPFLVVEKTEGPNFDKTSPFKIAKDGLINNAERIKKERRTYRIDRLQDKSVGNQLEEEINKKLEKPINNDLEEKWNTIQKSMTEATNLCIGRTEIKKRLDCFDDDCKKALMTINAAKIEKDRNNTQATKTNYEVKRREAKQICRQRKREQLEKRLKAIENHYANNNIKNFYEEIEKLEGNNRKTEQVDLLNKDEQIEPKGQEQIQRNDTEQTEEPTELENLLEGDILSISTEWKEKEWDKQDRRRSYHKILSQCSDSEDKTRLRYIFAFLQNSYLCANHYDLSYRKSAGGMSRHKIIRNVIEWTLITRERLAILKLRGTF